MVTIKDIAKKANVSKTTVSRILNNKQSEIKISDSTKEKVLKIAEDLEYQPNRNAQALALNKSKMLGLIFESTQDPFFNEMVSVTEKKANELDYNIILATVEQKSVEEILNLMFRQHIADGLLICEIEGIRKNKKLLNNIINQNFSIVFLSDYYKGFPCINVDNYKGAYMATNYLLENNYEKLGIISGPDHLERRDSYERFKGFKNALKDNNVKFYPEYYQEGSYSFESGYKAMQELCGVSPLPDAIFACDDLMALGAISAAYEMSIDIPNDVAIIGFDNIMQSQYSTPKLTTIAQPRNEMGSKAVEILVDMINDRPVEKKNYLFQPHLVVRNST